MAEDKEQSHESAILGSFYKKWQANSLDAFTQVHDKYTKTNKNDLQESRGANVTEGLTRHAGFLQEANDSLSDLRESKGEYYDSEASHAAGLERGIRDKMQAMNMLDGATEEVGYDPMSAEFTDPVTGEKVDAESFDYNSNRALRGSIRKDVDGAYNANSRSMQSVQNIFRGQYSIHDARKNKDSRTHRGGDSDLNAVRKAEFGQLFGKENGDDMAKVWKEGRLDMQQVWQQLADINKMGASKGRQQMTELAKGTYEQRQQSSIDHAADYNKGQNYARQIGDEQADKAADAKIEIKSSINEDKATLAKRGAGNIGRGKRKARIDYGGTGTSNRPI